MARLILYHDGVIKVFPEKGNTSGILRSYVSLDGDEEYQCSLNNKLHFHGDWLSTYLNQPLALDYDIFEDRLIAWQFDKSQRILSLVFLNQHSLKFYAIFLNKDSRFNIGCDQESCKYEDLYQQWKDDFGIEVKLFRWYPIPMIKFENVFANFTNKQLLHNLLQNKNPLKFS